MRSLFVFFLQFYAVSLSDDNSSRRHSEDDERGNCDIYNDIVSGLKSFSSRFNDLIACDFNFTGLSIVRNGKSACFGKTERDVIAFGITVPVFLRDVVSCELDNFKFNSSDFIGRRERCAVHAVIARGHCVFFSEFIPSCERFRTDHVKHIFRVLRSYGNRELCACSR